MTVILAIVCLLWVGALLWAEHAGRRPLKWTAKSAASLCFVLVALNAGALESAYGQWVLAALVLCMGGDILLIPADRRVFLAGMGAFALGHAAYIAAFLQGAAAPGLVFLATGAGMAVFAALSLRWLWPHLAVFRAPVAIYAAIIAAMVAASVLAQPPGRPVPDLLVIAGAVGFAVSDLSVARDQFIRREFFNKAWGLPLYYGAQLLLASSV